MGKGQYSKIKKFGDKRVLFCYLDEAGDFDFSPTGTPYYLCTALVVDNPLPLNDDLLRAKYLLILNNLSFSKSHQGNDYFHASEDSLLTRDIAYEAISKHLDEFRVYSIVVQKNKTHPSLRDERNFFAMIMKNLLADVVKFEQITNEYDHLCIITDKIPVQKKSGVIISSIKKNLKILLENKIGYSLVPMVIIAR